MSRIKEESLRGLSIRGLQALGAEVFDRYCESKNLRHQYIDDFVDFQWNLLASGDVVAWNNSMPELGCFGSGDPIDREFSEYLERSSVDTEELLYLAGCLVEISLINLFAAVQPDESIRFLFKATEIAEKNNIKIPATSLFSKASGGGPDGWGKVFSKEEVAELRKRCKEDRRLGPNQTP